MTFEMTLRGQSFYAVETSTCHFGFDGVKQIRKELGINVPIEKIDSKITAVEYDVTLVVDEDLARKSGRFNKSSRIVINCPAKWGNRFLKQVVSSVTDEATGEITSATLEWQFDKEEFLKWWESNDFPTEIEDE